MRLPLDASIYPGVKGVRASFQTNHVFQAGLATLWANGQAEEREELKIREEELREQAHQRELEKRAKELAEEEDAATKAAWQQSEIEAALRPGAMDGILNHQVGREILLLHAVGKPARTHSHKGVRELRVGPKG
jgi:hypothetical protein